jgi:hypothetical protein
MRWWRVSNQIKVEKHFHKYNINHIYKNMNKTSVKTATASTKTAKPAAPTGKPAAPAKPSGGKKK